METLEQVAQWGCECSLPGSIQGSAGWACEQPGVEGSVPAYSWGGGGILTKEKANREEGIFLHKANRMIFWVPADLAVIGSSLHLTYGSPRIGCVFYIWVHCQVHRSSGWNKMPKKPLSQDLPSASQWLTTESLLCSCQQYSPSHITLCRARTVLCHVINAEKDPDFVLLAILHFLVFFLLLC